MEEIEDYFKEAETDDIDTAYVELKDEDITMDEIRLIRLKFLSDYGN
jgi:ATP-dependent DNA helicase RecQ